jgi:hypothetical protein
MSNALMIVGAATLGTLGTEPPREIRDRPEHLVECRPAQPVCGAPQPQLPSITQFPSLPFVRIGKLVSLLHPATGDLYPTAHPLHRASSTGGPSRPANHWHGQQWRQPFE